jgi:hypothetical protein
MVGRVFISCGQRGSEQSVSQKVAKLLHDRFGLDSYLAFKIQGLNDIMKITEELKASDYYLFINFHRKNDADLPFSLFTHQELALAHHVGFRDMIALQEKGAPIEGFLKYVQSNPEFFENEEDLLKKIELLVRERKWNPGFSRNLILTGLSKLNTPIIYEDQTGQHFEFIWHARIENRRPDIAAVNAVCILDSIEFSDGEKLQSPDRSYLKWARHAGYNRTILPEDFAFLDLFSVHADQPGVFLHSALDSRHRPPIVTADGCYKLYYKLFSEGFPLLSFCVRIDYHHTIPITSTWENSTDSQIIV